MRTHPLHRTTRFRAALPRTFARSLCAVALVCGNASAHAHAPRAQVHPAGRSAPATPPGDHLAPLRPGYLGVGLRDLDAAEETRLRSSGDAGEMGAMIVTVDRDAPAWTAGLRPGDVVVEFNGEPVNGVDDLRRRLRACAEGRAVTLRVRRNGGAMTVPVVLGDEQAIAAHAFSRHLGPPPEEVSPPDELPAPAAGFLSTAPGGIAQHGMAATLLDALIPASAYTGLEVDALTPQLATFFGVHGQGGLLVTAVRADSPAQGAGLLAGDIIVRAADRPVVSRSSLAHAVRSSRGAALPLTVIRNRRELSVSLRPGHHKGR